MVFFVFPGSYQKRYKKEKRISIRLREQLDAEIKKRMQLEEALKSTGISSEALRLITGKRNEPSQIDTIYYKGADSFKYIHKRRNKSAVQYHTNVDNGSNFFHTSCDTPIR